VVALIESHRKDKPERRTSNSATPANAAADSAYKARRSQPVEAVREELESTLEGARPKRFATVGF
jgi:hypothetical protein